MSAGGDRRDVLERALAAIDDLQARLLRAETGGGDPIAVIGLGCRLPGGASSPEEYWRLLEEGREAVGPVPPGRWDHSAYYDPDPAVPGSIQTTGASFLRDWEPDLFDARFFGISPREADEMDPQQRLLLEVVWETLEHAGATRERLLDSQTGVFVGLTVEEYALMHLALLPAEAIGGHTLSGVTHNFAAGRIAYLLGLRGPAVTLDTACSSSLVAVHLACQSLRAHETDSCIAAGTSLLLTPGTFVTMSRWGSLSPDGRCRTFDESADGLGRGEGCAAVLLRRLADAEADGDRVLAVIRGSAVNQDGRSSSLTVPNGTAQQRVIERALRNSGLGPDDIDHVEAHGTGTPLGDPIELDALAEVFAQRQPGLPPVVVGSAKTNIGHVEAAAGLAGLVKVVLSLWHRRIPAHLHLRRFTSRTCAPAELITVSPQGAAWPVSGRPARAGVSAFGVTGTNAHAVLEEYLHRPESLTVPATPGADLVFCLDGATTEATRANARALLDWLRGPGCMVPLEDVAHTLRAHRSRLLHRTIVVARDPEELAVRLSAAADGRPRRGVVSGTASTSHVAGAVWVFSGFGSHWDGMGRELLGVVPGFAGMIDELEGVFLEEGGFSVRRLLEDGLASADPALVPAAVYAVQVALTAVLRDAGVRPAAVLGHSMGEIAAAVAASALSPQDGARVVWRRTRALARLAGDDQAMALVMQPEARVLELLRAWPALSVAVVSSPQATVVAGPAGPVREFVTHLDGMRIVGRLVPDAVVAGHSPQVDPLVPLLAAQLSDLRPAPADVPCYLTSRSDPRQATRFDAAHWAANVRNPVRFTDAVRAAVEDGHRVFLEIAPSPVVVRAVQETLAEVTSAAGAVTCALKRERPEVFSLLEALALLHTNGCQVDWSALQPPGRFTDLPRYAWQPTRHWFPPHRANGPGAGHPLLGTHVVLPGTPAVHVRQTTLDPAILPWLADHRSSDLVVLPGTAYIEMALTSAAEACTGEAWPIHLRDLRFLSPLRTDRPIVVTSTLTWQDVPPGALHRSGAFEVTTVDRDGRAVRHATCRVEVSGAGVTGDSPGELEPALGEETSAGPEPEEVYRRLRRAGQHHGPAFQGLVSLRLPAAPQSRRAWAAVELPAVARSGAKGFTLHPALLDSCLQTLAAVPAVADEIASRPDGSLLVPTAVREITVVGPLAGPTVTSVAELAPGTVDVAGSTVSAGVTVTGSDGRLVARLSGVTLRWLEPPARDVAEGLVFQHRWSAQPLPDRSCTPSGAMVLADDPLDPLVAEVMRHLPDSRLAVVAGFGGDELTETLGGAPVAIWIPGMARSAGADPSEVGLESSTRLVTLVAAAARAEPSMGRLYVVTQGAAAVPGDDAAALRLEHAALRAVVRTAAFELPQQQATLVDVAPDCRDEGAGRGALVAAEIAAAAPDDEVALRGPRRFVGRLVAGSDQRERPRRRVDLRRGGCRLDSCERGRLDRVVPHLAPRRPPGPGEVEIHVHAAGVNFSDVLKAMGGTRMPEGDDRPLLLGGECAGVVRGVGAGVTRVRPGERVAAVGWGCFGPFVTTGEQLTVRVPAGLDFQVAAGVPVVFGTVWYALHRSARLSAGERLLVHSATGGVGRAALSFARRAGAEVFATAGTAAKRDLLRSLGVEHVYDSRGLGFVDEVLRDTGGRGVDVVLNSLAGAALSEGLRLLAPHGRFVELGKRDLHDDLRIGLLPFARGLTLSAVDFDLLARTRPHQVASLLDEIMAAVAEGSVEPVPVTAWPLERAAGALAAVAAAEHVGKLVISVPATGCVDAEVDPGSVPFVRSDGAYVVTGGLSGLGLEAAVRLAEDGARRVVLNARSAPSADAAAVLSRIRARGPEVEVILGDIGAPGTAEALIEAAERGGVRLRGVLHSAALLDDAAILRTGPDRMSGPWRSKAGGAWRLHRATMDRDLDWFVLFSSTSGLLGAAGQANYAAASAFTDALAEARVGAGLPALAVDWGPWAGTRSSPDLAARGRTLLTAEEGFGALRRLVADGRSRAMVAHLDSGWFERFPAAADRPFLAEVLGAGAAGEGAGESTVLAELRALPPGPRRRLRLERELAAAARAVLRAGPVPVEADVPFASLGFDSLMALELRNALETTFALELPATLAWTHPTLAVLAPYLAERLDLSLDLPQDRSAPSTGDPGDLALLDAIVEVAESDAQRRSS
jgi:phthiocerol/phenolphthiocerol synthesis type-I polyketide synthase C